MSSSSSHTHTHTHRHIYHSHSHSLAAQWPRPKALTHSLLKRSAEQRYRGLEEDFSLLDLTFFFSFCLLGWGVGGKRDTWCRRYRPTCSVKVRRLLSILPSLLSGIAFVLQIYRSLICKQPPPHTHTHTHTHTPCWSCRPS